MDASSPTAATAEHDAGGADDVEFEVVLGTRRRAASETGSESEGSDFITGEEDDQHSDFGTRSSPIHQPLHPVGRAGPMAEAPNTRSRQDQKLLSSTQDSSAAGKGVEQQRAAAGVTASTAAGSEEDELLLPLPPTSAPPSDGGAAPKLQLGKNTAAAAAAAAASQASHGRLQLSGHSSTRRGKASASFTAAAAARKEDSGVVPSANSANSSSSSSSDDDCGRTAAVHGAGDEVLDVTSSDSEAEGAGLTGPFSRSGAAAARGGRTVRGKGRGGEGKGTCGSAVHHLPEELSSEEGEVHEGDDVILSKDDLQLQRQLVHQRRRRPLEPFEVPRSGAFYAHDDRGEQSIGTQPIGPSAAGDDHHADAAADGNMHQQGEMATCVSSGGGKWKHDMFEEMLRREAAGVSGPLVIPGSEFSRGVRGGSRGRGGQSGSRDRQGSTGDYTGDCTGYDGGSQQQRQQGRGRGRDRHYDMHAHIEADYGHQYSSRGGDEAQGWGYGGTDHQAGDYAGGASARGSRPGARMGWGQSAAAAVGGYSGQHERGGSAPEYDRNYDSRDNECRDRSAGRDSTANNPGSWADNANEGSFRAGSNWKQQRDEFQQQSGSNPGYRGGGSSRGASSSGRGHGRSRADGGPTGSYSTTGYRGGSSDTAANGASRFGRDSINADRQHGFDSSREVPVGYGKGAAAVNIGGHFGSRDDSPPPGFGPRTRAAGGGMVFEEGATGHQQRNGMGPANACGQQQPDTPGQQAWVPIHKQSDGYVTAVRPTVSQQRTAPDSHHYRGQQQQQQYERQPQPVPRAAAEAAVARAGSSGGSRLKPDAAAFEPGLSYATGSSSARTYSQPPWDQQQQALHHSSGASKGAYSSSQHQYSSSQYEAQQSTNPGATHHGSQQQQAGDQSPLQRQQQTAPVQQQPGGTSIDTADAAVAPQYPGPHGPLPAPDAATASWMAQAAAAVAAQAAAAAAVMQGQVPQPSGALVPTSGPAGAPSPYQAVSPYDMHQYMAAMMQQYAHQYVHHAQQQSTPPLQQPTGPPEQQQQVMAPAVDNQPVGRSHPHQQQQHVATGHDRGTYERPAPAPARDNSSYAYSADQSHGHSSSYSAATARGFASRGAEQQQRRPGYATGGGRRYSAVAASGLAGADSTQQTGGDSW